MYMPVMTGLLGVWLWTDVSKDDPRFRKCLTWLVMTPKIGRSIDPPAPNVPPAVRNPTRTCARKQNC